jgi:ABC-type transporter Mla MlaB component
LRGSAKSGLVLVERVQSSHEVKRIDYGALALLAEFRNPDQALP